MTRTLEQWIMLNRPVGWRAGVSSPTEVRYGSVELMEYAWKNGARKFAKVPVTLGRMREDGEIELSRRSGEVRPLLDPEPLAEGDRFILTWHDGIAWCDLFSEDCLMPPSDRSDDLAWDQFEAYRQAVVKRVSERLDEIIVTEFKTAGLEFVELGDLHRSIGRAWREIRNGNEILGLAIAFSRGKTYGRAEAISELGSLIERDESRSRNDDWVEIVVAAQGRHGRKLSPLALLEKMGGVRHATEKKWTFPGGEIVDQQKFVAWCKAANKRPSRNPI